MIRQALQYSATVISKECLTLRSKQKVKQFYEKSLQQPLLCSAKLRLWLIFSSQNLCLAFFEYFKFLLKRSEKTGPNCNWLVYSIMRAHPTRRGPQSKKMYCRCHLCQIKIWLKSWYLTNFGNSLTGHFWENSKIWPKNEKF